MQAKTSAILTTGGTGPGVAPRRSVYSDESDKMSLVMINSNFSIREAVGEDLPFIYSTWARSYRYDSPIGRSCKNSIFFPAFNKVIDHILSQSSTQVALAVKPDQPHVLFGYMVHQPDVVHYAFTKEAFWNHGIAKALLTHLGGAKFYSHKTMTAQPILKRFPDLSFNPFVLYKQENQNGETSQNIS